MIFYNDESFMSQADGFIKAVAVPGLARDIVVYLNRPPHGRIHSPTA